MCRSKKPGPVWEPPADGVPWFGHALGVKHVHWEWPVVVDSDHSLGESVPVPVSVKACVN